MQFLHVSPERDPALGSYARFAAGRIDGATRREALGVYLYYTQVDDHVREFCAIELVPGFEAYQDSGKRAILNIFKEVLPDMVDQEALWAILVAGRAQ